MVIARSLVVMLFALAMGCSLVNSTDMHTRGRDTDRDAATPGDAGTPEDTATPATGPLLRFAHLGRDTGTVDVYADDRLIAEGVAFSSVSTAAEVPAGTVVFRVTRTGTRDQVLQSSLRTEPGRAYTLTMYGDQAPPMGFSERTLGLLLLEDEGANTTEGVRLNVVHVATPIPTGALVSVTPDGLDALIQDFGFGASARLTVPSIPLTVGFDARTDGTIDAQFDLPDLMSGTSGTVFVAARADGSVFLLVNLAGGETFEFNVPFSPQVRVAHLARDAGPIDVYADGNLIHSGITFPGVSMPGELMAGEVVFRVTRAGTSDALLEQTVTLTQSRNYTLTFYGDVTPPPTLPERTLALLLLEDNATRLDISRDIRLAAVHVATPVTSGALVFVTPDGNETLTRSFAFTGVAALTRRSRPYTLGFDAGEDGIIEYEFVLPALFPGTYANVFVAARASGRPFLLVNTARGATLSIDPR